MSSLFDSSLSPDVVKSNVTAFCRNWPKVQLEQLLDFVEYATREKGVKIQTVEDAFAMCKVFQEAWTERAKEKLKQVGKNIKDKAESISDSLDSSIELANYKLERSSRDAGRAIKYAVQSTGDKIQTGAKGVRTAVSDSLETIKSKLQKAKGQTKRAVKNIKRQSTDKIKFQNERARVRRECEQRNSGKRKDIVEQICGKRE